MRMSVRNAYQTARYPLEYTFSPNVTFQNQSTPVLFLQTSPSDKLAGHAHSTKRKKSFPLAPLHIEPLRLTQRVHALHILNVANSVVEHPRHIPQHLHAVPLMPAPPNLVHQLPVDLLQLFDGTP